MKIPKEFQGEFQGKFKENSLFHDDCGKITGELFENSKRNSRDNYLGIPGIFLELFGRDQGGIRKEFGRLPEGFLGTRFTILVLALFH